MIQSVEKIYSWQAASDAVTSLLNLHPELCEMPINLAKVAQLLNIRINDRTSGMAGWIDFKDDKTYININKNKIEGPYYRFAVAHEIGHAILKNDDNLEYEKTNHYWKESFATNFAHNLIVPEFWRNKKKNIFISCQSPELAVQLAHECQATLYSLFSAISNDTIGMKNSNNIWFQAKMRINNRTKQDYDLRIHQPCYNSDLFFIPNNKRIKKIMSDVTWLENLAIGIVETKLLNVKLCHTLKNAVNKYKWENTYCNVSVIRLRDRRKDKSSQYLMLIRPQ